MAGSDPARAEIAAYRRQLAWILDQVRICLSGLTSAQLGWRPETPEANTPWAIGSHVVGSTRAYVLGFGCGLAVERDRTAEFDRPGQHAGELIEEIDRLAAVVDSALAGLAPPGWTRRLSPLGSCGGSETLRRSPGGRPSSRPSGMPRCTSGSFG